MFKPEFVNLLNDITAQLFNEETALISFMSICSLAKTKSLQCVSLTIPFSLIHSLPVIRL